MATERAYERMMALTATEVARPTRTPTPSPVPTLTLVATSTPIPTATSTQIVVVVQVVQTIQVTVQAAPEKRAEGVSPVGWLIVGTVLLVLVFGAAILLRPQTYILPFRGDKRDE